MNKFLLFTVAAALGAGTLMAQAEPVFPTEFDVTASSRGITINQYVDEDRDAPVIEVGGVCAQENFTLTFNLPDGWTGVVGGAMGGIMNYSTRAEESQWVPMDYFKMMMGDSFGDMMEGTNLTFAADGKTLMYTFFLYADDNVDVANGFLIAVNVEQGEVPDPVFPTEFDVTTDSKNVTISQYTDEDTDAPVILLTGSTDKDEVNLNFNLPAEWDGVIGGIMNVMGTSTRSMAEWPTIDVFKEMMEGFDFMEGKQLSFKVSDQPQMGMFWLYSDNRVDTANGFHVVLMVDKQSDPNSVDMIAADSASARYFNLQGQEISNPGNGIFIKVANGKASKVLVK